MDRHVLWKVNTAYKTVWLIAPEISLQTSTQLHRIENHGGLPFLDNNVTESF
jgi:hypothetical protein